MMAESTDWLGFWSAVSTIGTLVFFIGVVFWAMSSKRKKDFDAAANLPLEDVADSERTGK